MLLCELAGNLIDQFCEIGLRRPPLLQILVAG